MACDIHLNICVNDRGPWHVVKPPVEPRFDWNRWPGADRDYDAFASLGYTGRSLVQPYTWPTIEGWPRMVQRSIMYAPGWDGYDHSERWIPAELLRRAPALPHEGLEALRQIVLHYDRAWWSSGALLIFGFDS